MGRGGASGAEPVLIGTHRLAHSSPNRPHSLTFPVEAGGFNLVDRGGVIG